ncbi:MAG: DegT/DnrJ/EryC1/StrS family aminotransferase, partial [Candidatus Omnitrophica bacterium]|nr:DegT/DnrJ/EryC1/StrS family aminotransferase [Candidatus Omnitrophota bacterium]
FHAAKTITMGEGGFVVAADRKIFDKIDRLCDQGMRKGKRYWHDSLGFNFRITDLQAAIGCGQLQHLDRIRKAKARIHQVYTKELFGAAGTQLQRFTSDVDPLAWAIAVKIDADIYKGGRDGLIERFAQAGVETRPGFYPFSVMPFYKAPRLPVSEDVGQNVICFPSFVGLSDLQIRKICGLLKKFRQ